MVRSAESLKVRLIPEQAHVAAVRNDVVKVGPDLQTAFPLALDAKRLFVLDALPHQSPPWRSIEFPHVYVGPMALAQAMGVAAALGYQRGTAWLTTGP